MTWLDAPLDALAGYPRWLVVACATVLTAAAIWVLAKILKWSLYLLILAVLVGGSVWVGVLLLE